MGSGILARAFVQAYRQALASKYTLFYSTIFPPPITNWPIFPRYHFYWCKMFTAGLMETWLIEQKKLSPCPWAIRSYNYNANANLGCLSLLQVIEIDIKVIYYILLIFLTLNSVLDLRQVVKRICYFSILWHELAICKQKKKKDLLSGVNSLTSILNMIEIWTFIESSFPIFLFFTVIEELHLLSISTFHIC